jgi:hypothetical protein
MSSQAAGELASRYVVGNVELPWYAKLFLLDRYEDAEYQKELERLRGVSGQL